MAMWRCGCFMLTSKRLVSLDDTGRRPSDPYIAYVKAALPYRDHERHLVNPMFIIQMGFLGIIIFYSFVLDFLVRKLPSYGE